jgi:hypothetical protein
MDYGSLLKRAGQITWRFKFLWLFGIPMALCGQSSTGRINCRTNYSIRTSAPMDWGDASPDFPAFLPEPMGQVPLAVYVAAAVALVLLYLVVGLVVGAIGRSALIRSTVRIEAGEGVTLSTSWKDGLAKAWPVGVLQAVLYSPLWILILVASVVFLTQFLPVFTQITTRPRPGLDVQPPLPYGEEFFRLFPLFFAGVCTLICIGFIIQVIASLFLTFGSRTIVLENVGVINSFSRSWFLFRRNLGATILLALILLVLGIVVGVVLMIPTMIIMFPAMMATVPRMFSGIAPAISDYILLAMLGLLLYVVFSFIRGIFQVFIETLWTLAYREFVEEAAG